MAQHLDAIEPYVFSLSLSDPGASFKKISEALDFLFIVCFFLALKKIKPYHEHRHCLALFTRILGMSGAEAARFISEVKAEVLAHRLHGYTTV